MGKSKVRKKHSSKKHLSSLAEAVRETRKTANAVLVLAVVLSPYWTPHVK